MTNEDVSELKTLKLDRAAEKCVFSSVFLSAIGSNGLWTAWQGAIKNARSNRRNKKREVPMQ